MQVGKFVEKFARLSALAVVTLATMFLSTGCEDDGDDSGGSSGGGSFVGVWSLYEGGAVGTGTPAYYAHFNSDGSFYFVDGPNGPNGDAHFGGTYQVSDGKLDGSLQNPGVGSGQVIATINNGTMSLDFIEFWHSPPKHIPHTGTKQ